MKAMLEYLKTSDEATDCNGAVTEEDDFCSCIQTVKEDIESTETLIRGADHFIEKHNADLKKRNSQLEFLFTFDLAQSCEV